MQIVQAVFGVFHHFELAHQLHERGHLRRIYSTWPWARLKREGLPRSLVRTFPALHTTSYLLQKYVPRSFTVRMNRWTTLAFDAYTLRDIPQSDAFIAISGAGLRTGQLVQQRGGVYICDRGSTHQRFQESILRDEFKRWGLNPPPDPAHLAIREEEIYRVADAITVPSEIARRSFMRMGVPEAKIHVIPYGVRLDFFEKVADPPTDTFDVLFAGQASLRKGVPYLLQAFAGLRHSGKRLRLAGSIHPQLRSMLAQLPVGPEVEFLGPLSREQLAALMSRSHLLVLPSIEDGYGMVIPQAMACGCPVLASADAGGSEVILDGVNGFVTPTRDVAAMTARMQQLAENPGLQQRMGAAALEGVRRIGGWDDYGARWVQLLQQLTGKH